MTRNRKALALTLSLCIAGAAYATAQESGASESPPGPDEVVLELEREFFVYPTDGRRDPFVSLAKSEDMGPRFEELRITGIIYSDGGGSVALLEDANNEAHRVRKGTEIGNARVVEIGRTRVVFAVENFGVVRQEQLEMSPKDSDEVKP